MTGLTVVKDPDKVEICICIWSNSLGLFTTTGKDSRLSLPVG